jgi:branched-chain amino acid transport system permease protein
MVMIGGLGNTLGVLVGVVTVQAAHVLVPFAKDWIGFDSDVAGALRLGLIGAILLACLLWRSEGLVPEKLRKIP